MHYITKLRKEAFGAALLSGILVFASFPGINLFWVAWIAFIPLLMAIQRVGLAGSFVLGFITGLTANIGMLYWIYPMIKFNTDSVLQALICLLAISSYMALYFGFWATALRIATPSLTDKSIGEDLDISGALAKTERQIFYEILHKRFWENAYTRLAGFSLLRFSLFAASLWVSLEYMRTYFLTGFPWLLLGMSQWKFTSLIQISEFTGVYGISFILILTNVSLARFLRTKRVTSFVFVLAALAFVTAASYTIKLRNDISAPPYMTVAVLQANIDQYKKWDSSFQNDITRVYTELALQASRANPDLIVWPETAVPGYLPANRYLYDWVRSAAKDTKTYNLIGTPYNNGGAEYYNAVLLFGPEGEMLGAHKKTHLVPFGEFVPFRKFLEPFFGVLNNLGDFTLGRDNNVFPVKSIICASSICSENFFGSTIRRFVLNGAEVIINQTNDAWFFKTTAAEQHFIMNVFRAIENRRTIIVSGNTGISGIVSPGGVIKYRTKLFEKTYFVAKVSPNRYITFYTKHGDLFAQSCLLIALMMMLVTKRKIFLKKK